MSDTKKEVKVIQMFVTKPSTKITELEKAHSEAVNNSNKGIEVFKALSTEKEKQTTTWMIEIAKKAALKHEELKTACDKAVLIKPDQTFYNDQGIADPKYSAETWKKKNEPFKKLETLAVQIDTALVKGTVEEFKKLENLLK